MVLIGNVVAKILRWTDTFSTSCTARLFPTLGLAVLVLSGVFSGCRGRVEEAVEYDVHRLPIAGFRKLTFLGVARAKGIDKAQMEHLQASIGQCQRFEKVSNLDRGFKLAEGDKSQVSKKLRSDLRAFQDARYVHGVLVVEPIKRSTLRSSEQVTHVTVLDSPDHTWFDSYGYAADPRSSLFGVDEIGPRLKYTEKKTVQRQTKIEVGIRYALYNKNLDQMVFDRKSFASASIATYSGKPLISEKGVMSALYRSLLARVTRSVCSKMATVERTLLADGKGGKADDLIQKGIDLAGDDSWEAAADQWKKAVLIDKKSAYAYHNLGIYYERSGNVAAAMEEFEKAKRFGGRGFTPKQYDDSLTILRPHFDPLAMEPMVFAISGANWVSIFGGNRENLIVGKEYQVYRVRRFGGSPDFQFDGMSVVEAGRVRVVKHEAPFVLARVTQFLDGVRVERGDVIVTGGSH